MATTNDLVAIGLSNVYVSKQLTDVSTSTPTYDTAFALPGAVTLSFNSAASLSSMFADDGVFKSFEGVGEMGITLTLAGLRPEHEATLFGHTYSGGAVIKKSTDTSPYISIAGKVLLDDGSYGYVRYYKVKLGKPNAEDQTKEATPAGRTVTCEGRVVGLTSSTYQGLYMEKVRSDDTAIAAGYLTDFLTTIKYASADNGALTAVASVSSGKFRWTVTKSGGGNITLSSAQTVAANMPIMSEATGAQEAGSYAITGNGTATVYIDFTPTVAFSSGEDVSGAIIGNRVYDQNGIAITQVAAALEF